MRWREAGYFYRFLSWEDKITGFRPILYTFFAYTLSERLQPFFWCVNSLAWLGAFLFFGPFDDWWDFYLEGKKSFLVYWLNEKNVSPERILTFIFLPLLLAPLVFLLRVGGGSYISLFLYFFTLFLVISYALPPLRIKKRKVLGFLVAPSGAVLLFLQSYLITNRINRDIVFLAFLIFFFQAYAESLHRLEKNIFSSKEREALKFLITGFALLSFLVSLIASFLNPVFLVSSLSAMVRLISVRRLDLDSLSRLRRNIFCPLLSPYDFLFYAGWGLIKLFNLR